MESVGTLRSLGMLSPSGAVPHGASKQLSSSYMSQQILWLLLKPTT